MNNSYFEEISSLVMMYINNAADKSVQRVDWGNGVSTF